ncbi:hypothetical protein [Salinisphaera sp. T31B1]|uniref:hypothetical protein n=1 Tax=Salinisphaera sp. T31B1 TaxID=727963 RepID=UPI0033412E1F
MSRPTASDTWRWIAACTWRFGAAGPPLGVALVIVPAMVFSASPPDDIVGGWLFFSIFSYAFVGLSALLAGLFYGLVKQRTQHRSRWRLGGLCGVLGWLGQCTVLALALKDPGQLDSLWIMPLAALVASLCARFVAPSLGGTPALEQPAGDALPASAGADR